MKTNRLSIYYIFEDTVRNRSNDVAIWSRQGEYTWGDLSRRANQYATYFLALGVRPGDLVAFYLQNSPEFFFAWVGLLAIGNMTCFQDLLWSLNHCHIGCAPAMINWNLSGDGLVHCLKISKAKVLLVDEDHECAQRVMSEAKRIREELQMEIVELSQDQKRLITAEDCPRLSDQYRRDVRAGSPSVLLYTRHVWSGQDS